MNLTKLLLGGFRAEFSGDKKKNEISIAEASKSFYSYEKVNGDLLSADFWLNKLALILWGKQ